MKQLTEKSATSVVEHILARNESRTHSAEQEEHVRVMARFGAKLVLAAVATGEIYRQAAEYVRANKLSKELVFDTWEPLGVAKSRISEFHRVANAPDEVWAQYQARTLGWKGALNMTRGTLKLLLTAQEQQTEQRFLDAIPPEGTDTAVPEPGKAASAASSGVVAAGSKQTPLDKLGAAADKCARAAEDAEVRSKTFKCANGFTVKVWRHAKVTKVSADDDAAEDGDTK